MNQGPDVLLVGPLADADFRALDHAGVTTEAFDSCLQAISRLERTRSSLVVLSSRNLEGRGEAAIRALRGTSGHPRVLLTVPPDLMSTAEDFHGSEVDAFLHEPYFPEDLVARVEKLLATDVPPPEPVADIDGEALASWLVHLGEMHGSVDNLTHVSEYIAALVCKQSAAESVSVYLPTTSGAPLTLMTSTGPRHKIRLSLTGLEGGPAAESLRTGKVCADGRHLAVPLPLRDNVHGLILLGNPDEGSRFVPADADALGPLIGQASLAVSTSLKIRHLTDLSTIDDLTGLYNSRFFRRSLEGEFRRAERYERPLSLAIIDVDHFKIFNDLNGHEAGNRCLKQLADIMKAGFRTTDAVCRYGGEEFSIILPEVARGAPGDGAGAYRVLDRLRARIEASSCPGQKGLPGGTLTVSCGVAGFPLDARDPGSLLEAADRALYLAKRTGRNRVCIPGDDSPAGEGTVTE